MILHATEEKQEDLPERDNPSVRAPESAKLKDLEPNFEIQSLLDLDGVRVEERFDEDVMVEVVWEVEDEHGGRRNAIGSGFWQLQKGLSG